MTGARRDGCSGVRVCAGRLLQLLASVVVLHIGAASADVQPLEPWQRLGACSAGALLPQTVDCERIRINGAAFLSTRLLVQLPKGPTMVASGARSGDDWQGRFLTPNSHFRCGLAGRSLVCTISADDGRFYRVRPSVTDGMILERLDPAKYPPEEPPLMAPDDLSVVASAACKDSPDSIDVLAVYSLDAVEAVLTEDALRQAINNSLEAVNQSFIDSDVALKLSWGTPVAVPYRSSGDITFDLVALTGDGDAYLDEVHKLRDDRKADLVVLITGTPAGVGQSQQFRLPHLNEPSSFARRAFAVVSYNAMTGPTYALGHELGHLMGAGHDFGTTNGVEGPFDYSHGHRQFVADPPCIPWMDTMSQYNWCPLCKVEPIWSSPKKRLCGALTGSVKYEDNAETLRRTAPIVSKFRCKSK